MLELGNARTVIVQFSFSNGPAQSKLRLTPDETPREREGRKSQINGIKILEEKEKSSISNLFQELERAGYEIVDAFRKERIDGKDPRGKRTYHMMRFIFFRKDCAHSTEEFLVDKEKIVQEFEVMCATCLWRVRAFRNPFFANGEQLVGEHAVSINCEARVPLFRPDGTPVTIWEKDQNGDRVGDAPRPIVPEFVLSVQ